MPGVKKSSAPLSRQERAARTRTRIVEAALTEFLDRGFTRTTMDAVASRAGVAVQTVYFVFRTKGDLLHAVYEHVVLGPDGRPPHLMPWWPSVDDGFGLHDAVDRFVAGTVELLVRAAPLVWTVLGDETAAASHGRHEELRRQGYVALVAVLAEKHPLRPGVTPTRARDVLLVLTAPQLFVQLHRDLGWSLDEVRAWMSQQVCEQVFGISQTPPTV